MRPAAVTTRTAPGQDPAQRTASPRHMSSDQGRPGGGWGSGPLRDGPHSQEGDVSPGCSDVLRRPKGLRGGEGVDGEMPRPAEAPVLMFRAALAGAGASPHARGLKGKGGSPGAPLPLASLGHSCNASCGVAPLAAS